MKKISYLERVKNAGGTAQEGRPDWRSGLFSKRHYIEAIIPIFSQNSTENAKNIDNQFLALSSLDTLVFLTAFCFMCKVAVVGDAIVRFSTIAPKKSPKMPKLKKIVSR